MMLQCPSCARAQEPRLVCSQCGVPLAANLNLFAALGLPPLLQVDNTELESAYYNLGRRIHPDRFASASPEVRDASLRATALITRAYRTLRDPISRGLYWLELHDCQLAENNRQVPPDLAELVFDVQQQLSELRSGPEQGADVAEGFAELGTTHTSLVKLRDELNSDLIKNFASFDEGGGGSQDQLLTQLKTILSRIAYLRTLLRDVERELDLGPTYRSPH
jgi:molecular chaperone HscB